MRALCLAVLGLGGIWACSSFTTGSTDAPPSDAGVSDATVSADAAPIVQPDAGSFCATRPEPLCVDFEINGVYRGDWGANQTFEQSPEHGSIARDATMGLSSAASLHARLLGGPDTANVTVELGASAATIPDAAYLEADVFVKAPGAPFNADLTVLSLQRGPDTGLADVEAKITYVDLTSFQFSLYAETTGGPNGNKAAAIIPFDTWVHLRMESRLVGTAMGSATLFVDASPPVVVDHLTQLPQPETEHMRAILGLARYKQATVTTVDLYTDNVVAGPLP